MVCGEPPFLYHLVDNGRLRTLPVERWHLMVLAGRGKGSPKDSAIICVLRSS